MNLRPVFALLSSAALALAARAEFAASAQDARPLAAGVPAPAVTALTDAGEKFDVAAATKGRPALLIFYRGGWCPYCTKHLAALQQAEAELAKLGFQVLAFSPEPPAALAGIAAKHHLGYRLLSDTTGAAAQAFGLAFRVDADTQKKYAGYGIPLQPIPGEPDARWLPVPAAYLVGPDGVIRFAFSNPDYKARLAVDQLLAEARKAVSE
jgi:peroxiredoxin